MDRGEGSASAINFEFSMDLEQLGGEQFPRNVGVIWAMPTATSSPANQEYEVGAFLNGKVDEPMTKT